MKKLYLSEIVKNENIMLQKNKLNIFVAPAGSGKTYYIFNELLNPQEKSIYLCDTSNLKEAILRDDSYIDYVNCRQEEGLQHGFNIPKYNTTVMTYAEYGFHHEKYSNVKNIICDEIHNLYKYKDRFCNDNGNGNYNKVIEVLFDKSKNEVNVIGFTATHKRLKCEMDFLLPSNDSYIRTANNSNWNVINLSNHRDINRLESDFTFFYNNYRNLGHYLKAYNGFKYGKKAVLYTNRITECEDMVSICENVGLKAIALWSTRNENNPMNEEQLIVREYILDDGIIPDDYQVLIINGAYETGINIKDEDIEIVVVNTSDNDTRIQARSRVRKNIKAEIFKDCSCIEDLRIVVPNDYLDRPLTTKDKRELCKDINVYGEKTSLLKWTSLKPIIINSGYEVKDHRITKKMIRVSTITDIEQTKRII